MTVLNVSYPTTREALSVRQVSRGLDRIEVAFDEPNLVANAGLLLVSTLVVRLGLEALINSSLRLKGAWAVHCRRKVLSLVHAIVAGASHIDHVELLRAGATKAVLPHRVMAPSTLGTFLRSFTMERKRSCLTLPPSRPGTSGRPGSGALGLSDAG